MIKIILKSKKNLMIKKKTISTIVIILIVLFLIWFLLLYSGLIPSLNDNEIVKLNQEVAEEIKVLLTKDEELFNGDLTLMGYKKNKSWEGYVSWEFDYMVGSEKTDRIIVDWIPDNEDILIIRIRELSSDTILYEQVQPETEVD